MPFESVGPKLTVLAASGCILLQVCAAIFHTSSGEIQALPVNAVFLALAAFILWGGNISSFTPRRSAMMKAGPEAQV
jgi:hypothetical protein